MKTNHVKRTAKALKFHLSDGWCCRFLTARELARHAYISESHAYRILSGRQKLPKALHELLLFKVLGAVPHWPPGWYFDSDGLHAPDGYLFTADQLEQYRWHMDLMRRYEVDTERAIARTREAETKARQLQQENARLRAQLDDARRQIVAHEPRELRLYVNSERTPRRVLKVGT